MLYNINSKKPPHQGLFTLIATSLFMGAEIQLPPFFLQSSHSKSKRGFMPNIHSQELILQNEITVEKLVEIALISGPIHAKFLIISSTIPTLQKCFFIHVLDVLFVEQKASILKQSHLLRMLTVFRAMKKIVHYNPIFKELMRNSQTYKEYQSCLSNVYVVCFSNPILGETFKLSKWQFSLN